MGQTSKYNIHYPEAEDTANVPDDMQLLAEDVENTIEGISNNITDAYSNSKTYAVGDYCIYGNTLYKCTTAITTAESFNSNKWTATTIATELNSRLEFEVVESW